LLNFNENDVCDAYLHANKKDAVDWFTREKELLKLFDKHKGTDGNYVCIVSGSSGKDNAFKVHVLKYLHPSKNTLI
jgi:hypothetical protein